jgi:hypothetical protein
MTKAQAAAYLAAMIDGEGHVRVHKNRSVGVSNTEWDIIEAVAECCELLGLRYRVAELKRRPPRRQGWEVFINGKDSLERIRDDVPIRSGRKAAAVIEAVAAYTQLPRPPREWLEQKYTVEGLSLQQCAEAWGVKNSVSALGWLKYYGIPRRSISEANRNRYQKARK